MKDKFSKDIIKKTKQIVKRFKKKRDQQLIDAAHEDGFIIQDNKLILIKNVGDLNEC